MKPANSPLSLGLFSRRAPPSSTADLSGERSTPSAALVAECTSPPNRASMVSTRKR
ncbi:hypothetical protein SETIT_1G128000v2 [Setaria italica]|uniref:Uncharacterized protein n=1 Tax=Setaria italica TaxID=4555 RepID=A0A368PKQ4_SETIT|nr:hypothetical protein SETIT_1G128000v2 [Setaria italica]